MRILSESKIFFHLDLHNGVMTVLADYAKRDLKNNNFLSPPSRAAWIEMCGELWYSTCGASPPMDAKSMKGA